MRWLLMLVVYASSGVLGGMTLIGVDDDGEGNTLSETVKVLKSKVDALFDRRQEDFRLLEEAFRTTLEKNLDLVSLREEVAKLKKDLAGASQRNDHLKLQWLSDGLAELKGEVAELQNSTRSNSELLGSVRSEMSELKRDASNLRNLQAKMASRIKNVEKIRSSKFSRMNNWRDEADYNRVDVAVGGGEAQPQFRHHRVLRKRLEVVEMSSEALGQAQARLETKLQRLEHKLRFGDSERETFRAYEPSFEQRLLTLEATDKSRAANLLNVTRQLASLDKLHGSMLELLESVETIENKVDKSIPDLKSEISKMEFGSAQLTSTMAIIKEIQDNQQLSVKAMSSGISAMQDKMDTDRSRLLSLEMQLSTIRNITQKRDVLQNNLSTDILTNFSANQKMDANDNVTVRVSFPVTMQHLTRIISEYNTIRENLPNDCSEVKGPSGLYIIAPGESMPQLTWCDQDTGAGGWTVVQRRKDGSQKFNRNWNEYVVGFGSAEGEFWLGNEAIHQLTRDNDTTLRIDLTDIYGKVWHAEYDEFTVTSADDSYRLHISGYHGNASDALEYQNHMQFSTIDSDHDVSNTNCAANYEGGWWFSHCQHANLNGKYNMGLTWFDRSRNEWIAVARSEMKVRRKMAVADRT